MTNLFLSLIFTNCFILALFLYAIRHLLKAKFLLVVCVCVCAVGQLCAAGQSGVDGLEHVS